MTVARARGRVLTPATPLEMRTRALAILGEVQDGRDPEPADVQQLAGFVVALEAKLCTLTWRTTAADQVLRGELGPGQVWAAAPAGGPIQ